MMLGYTETAKLRYVTKEIAMRLFKVLGDKISVNKNDYDNWGPSVSSASWGRIRECNRECFKHPDFKQFLDIYKLKVI